MNLSANDLRTLFLAVEAVNVDDKIYDYLLSIAQVVRNEAYDFSTRANIQFLKADMAFISDFVIPEDIKACAGAMNHRILPDLSPDSDKVLTIKYILQQVKIQ